MKSGEMIGKQFGSYTVLGKAGYVGKNLYMMCRCVCGNERRVTAQQIKRGLATNCGCANIVPMEGRRFGKLVVLGYASTENKRRMFVCRCDCGSETKVRGADLRSGLQVSCGCFKNAQTVARNKAMATHGMTHTGVYRSWFAMRARCQDHNNIGWKNYGGRGIRVCDAWQDFLTFHRDMGDRPDGMTIDRIDPDGNYEPGNCRWATPKEQAANKRKRH